MCELLALEGTERVLEVGTGVRRRGARRARAGRRVRRADPRPGSPARRALDLTGHADVEVRVADDVLGAHDRAPFDAISVAAATDRVPQGPVRPARRRRAAGPADRWSRRPAPRPRRADRTRGPVETLSLACRFVPLVEVSPRRGDRYARPARWTTGRSRRGGRSRADGWMPRSGVVRTGSSSSSSASSARPATSSTSPSTRSCSRSSGSIISPLRSARSSSRSRTTTRGTGCGRSAASEVVLQGLRFLVVSTTALDANLLVLHLLVEAGLGEVVARRSRSCSYAVNFIGNKMWSFRHRR